MIIDYTQYDHVNSDLVRVDLKELIARAALAFRRKDRQNSLRRVIIKVHG